MQGSGVNRLRVEWSERLCEGPTNGPPNRPARTRWRSESAALDALQASEMLQDEDLELVEAVSQSLIDDDVVEYDQNAEAGDDDGMTFVDAGRRDRAREWRGPQAWRRRR
ncbi:MAG: hypothetical protein QOC82_2420 [Frankiaceae bacterium]|nr:hypothetical protein [Frankiaceae bacterium]